MIFENIEITPEEKDFMLAFSNVKNLLISTEEGRKIDLADDLVIKGFLNYTGRSRISSMNPEIKIEKVVQQYVWKPLAFQFFKHISKVN